APARAEDLAAWRYSKVIKLDTTASGAHVKGKVARFPLAVVLDANNFDFAQAKEGGADLRFALKAGGEPLPHAIETWDRAAAAAVVWVKLPLIKPNDRNQSFVMHWGNADAPDASDSKA